MARDVELFNRFESGEEQQVLRIYSWQPQCISLGYTQKPEVEIDLEKAAALGWDVVKRPTGGGIVFHNAAEVTYSLVTALDNPALPKGLVPSYKKLSEAVVNALAMIGIKAEIRNTKHEIRNKSQLCFSYPAEYEIVINDKKIVGSAQKRGRRALLQQGSIFVSPTPAEVFSVLKKPYEKPDAISLEEVLGRKVDFDELSQALIRGFKHVLG